MDAGDSVLVEALFSRLVLSSDSFDLALWESLFNI